LRHQLGAQFPVAKMCQKKNDRPPGAQIFVNQLEIFQLHVLLDFLDRHGTELEAAEDVRAQQLEMFSRDAAELGRRLGIAKGDLEVAPGQPPIAREQQPGTAAPEAAKAKDE